MGNGIKPSLSRKRVRNNSQRSISNVRSILCVAFVHSMKSARLSRSGTARELRKTTHTINRWLQKKSRIDVEAIAASSKLWPHFLRCLLMLERKAGRI